MKLKNIMDCNILVTIFTPTFNRSYSLHRVYESLCKQSYTYFEWLIIDDGSTDNTKEWVEKVQIDSSFPIRYYYQENSGKHIAINNAVALANGELFVIADSDDAFKSNSLECFIKNYRDIKGDRSYAGIWCLVENETGEVVGDTFPTDPWDCKLEDYYFKNKIQGEKWQIMRTNVMKKHPMPNIKMKGLNIGESIMWMSIAKSYKFRCINEALRIYYLSQDGIMQNNTKDEIVKWKGYLLQFQCIFNDYSEFYRYDPLYYFKGLILYNIALYKFEESHYSAFLGIKSLPVRSLFGLIYALLPIIMLFKHLTQFARK